MIAMMRIMRERVCHTSVTRLTSHDIVTTPSIKLKLKPKIECEGVGNGAIK